MPTLKISSGIVGKRQENSTKIFILLLLFLYTRLMLSYPVHLTPSRRLCLLLLGPFRRISVFLPKLFRGTQAQSSYLSILLSIQQISLVRLMCVLIDRQHCHIDFLLCAQMCVQIPEAFESSGISSHPHPVQTSIKYIRGQFLGLMERPSKMVGTSSELVLPPRRLFWWSSTSSPSCLKLFKKIPGIDPLH